MADAAPYPTVVARIGMPLDELRDRSGFKFDFARLRDSDMLSVTEPCVFSYAAPGGFTLPPTRFVSMDTNAAIVQFIAVSPHLSPLRLDAAVELVGSVAGGMAGAGWVRDDRNMVTVEELRVRVRDPDAPDRARWPVARLVLGPVEAVLAVKRLDRASTLGALFDGRDAFLMNVEISDNAFAARLDTVTETLSGQDGQTTPRPVDLDSYLARVRQMLGIRK